MQNKSSMAQTLNDDSLTRKSFNEYTQMGKKELLGSMKSFLSNFDRLRYKFVEMQLQNNYLERRNQMLEEQLNFYKTQVEKRTFKHGVPDIAKKSTKP